MAMDFIMGVDAPSLPPGGYNTGFAGGLGLPNSYVPPPGSTPPLVLGGSISIGTPPFTPRVYDPAPPYVPTDSRTGRIGSDPILAADSQTGIGGNLGGLNQQQLLLLVAAAVLIYLLAKA